MLDRATDDLIVIALACAATVLGVFAAGAAIYAALLQLVHPAWAAAIVAVIAFAVVGVIALMAQAKVNAKRRESEAAQTAWSTQLPVSIGGLAREHPIAALAASLIGGALAARHPRLARDLIAIIARMGSNPYNDG